MNDGRKQCGGKTCGECRIAARIGKLAWILTEKEEGAEINKIEAKNFDSKIVSDFVLG